MIKARFEFPKFIEFPNLSVFNDKGSAFFPLSGVSAFTGPEYILARSLGCQFVFESIVSIPFRHTFVEEVKEGVNLSESVTYAVHNPKPFDSCIKFLNDKRDTYAKKTLGNLIYKLCGNALYGQVTRGINNKLVYDSQLNETKKLPVGVLANPVLASWITAIVRTLLAEAMNVTVQNGHKVISGTTDGFMTSYLGDLDILMNEVYNDNKKEILCQYKPTLFCIGGKPVKGITPTTGRIGSVSRLFNEQIGLMNGGDTSIWEVKTDLTGIISITTRGQLGCEPTSGVNALTGIQKKF